MEGRLSASASCGQAGLRKFDSQGGATRIAACDTPHARLAAKSAMLASFAILTALAALYFA